MILSLIINLHNLLFTTSLSNLKYLHLVAINKIEVVKWVKYNAEMDKYVRIDFLHLFMLIIRNISIII